LPDFGKGNGMNTIRTIAVIGAMQPEIELLKGRLNNRESHRFGAFEIHCGELHGKRIVLIGASFDEQKRTIGAWKEEEL